MSGSRSGPFLGPRQPMESRKPESAVWLRAAKPGPGAYDPEKAVPVVKPSSPKWGMQGTGHFPNVNPAPCKGDYDITKVGSTGKDQTVSHLKSPPKSTFGTSRREDATAIYSYPVFTAKPR